MSGHVFHYTGSNSAFVNTRERLRLAAFRDRVSKALDSDAAPDVAPFAVRHAYADSLAFLLRESNVCTLYSNGPAALLHGPPIFQPFRVASWFHVVGDGDWREKEPFALEDLRAYTLHEDPERVRRARLALALLGDCDWTSAPRDVRAAYMYGEIVRAASP
jgi:hypothetical protein